MTITVYNEAGEVVTDPQEQARRLVPYVGPGEIRVYSPDGGLLAVRKSGPIPPEPTLLQRIMKKRYRALRWLAR